MAPHIFSNTYMFEGLRVVIAFFFGFIVGSFLQTTTRIPFMVNDEDCLFKLLQGPIQQDHPITLEAVKRYLNPPSTFVYNLTNPDGILNNKPGGMLSTLFDDQPPGFFIEAGAFDGEEASNSIWLEYAKGWTGLLIEASDTNYKDLLKKHRKAWSSNTCISTSNYPKTTILENLRRKGNVSTPYSDAVYKSNSRVIDSFFHEYKDTISGLSSFSYNEVQCFPFASYLFVLNVTTVDFLSLDTQGGEKDMLLNFPHDKINIRSICVEHFNKLEENPGIVDKHFIRKMKELGYKILAVGYDYLFIKENDPLASRMPEAVIA